MNKSTPKTIIESLQHYVAVSPEKRVYTILDKNCDELDQLNFAQLYAAVQNVAFKLRQRGVEEAKPIALTATSGKEFIIIFLGCLMARVIPVPLPSPRGKRQVDRIKTIFAHHGFNTIIADSSTAALLAEETDIHLIHSDELNAEAEACELPEIDGDDIAFLQYTSGSTSRPKGVAITHKNIIANEAYIYEGFGHDSETVILGWLPFHHDMGLIGNMLHPLYAGVHSIVMSPMDFLRNPANWLRMISKYRATSSGGPNFAYDLCLSAINPDELEGIDLSSWKVAFNGSEMIQERTLNLFTEKFSRFGFSKNAFLLCYGLAEATLYVTGRKFTGEAVHSEKHKANISCGTTAGDMQLCIVNPNTNEPMPEHGEGEIWVKGDSVAKEYWKDSANTQSVFAAYTSDGIGPYMRTGDLGYLHNDELFVSGRLKDLIIIRGQNLHPIDIESAIHDEFPALATFRTAIFSVREADADQLVILHELGKHQLEEAYTESLFKGIVARISAEFQVDIHSVAFLRENLLPRTTSGKIQNALAKRMFLENTFIYVACHSLSTKQASAAAGLSIDEMLGKLLNASALSDNVALIEYGLDSIKAVRLIHLLEDKFSVEIDISRLLNGLTLGEIKQKIAQSSGLVSSKAVATSAAQPIELAEAPLSYEQENIWIAQKLNPKDCSYNIPILLKLEGAFPLAMLKSCLEEVLSGYLSLNIVFEERHGSVFQVYKPERRQPIHIELLDHLSIQQQQEYIDRCYQKESESPFNLETECCSRATLFACSESLAYLLLDIHHIACDGWSFNLFKDDLLAAVYARMRGQNSSQPHVHSRTLFEYAIEQRNAISEASYHYWMQQLAGATTTSALSPLWNANHNYLTSENRGATLDFHLSPAQSQTLLSFCRESGITPAAAFLGLYHCLLHHYTRDANTIINYVGANRQQSKYRKTFGCFVNTLISRTDFTAESTLRAICQATHERLTENFKHEAYPFVELVRKVEQSADEEASALSRYFFVMQNAPVSITELRGINIGLEPKAASHSMYDMVLEVMPEADRFALKIEYRTAVVPPFLVEQYRDSFLALIDLLKTPHQLVPELDIGCLSLNSVSEGQIIAPLSTPAFDVIAALNQQAQLRPDKLALIDDSGSLSYSQLAAQIASLGGFIAAKTAKTNPRVVLPCVRSNAYVVNLLAVLSAGGCYIPLDLNQPDSVLETLLADLNPDLILDPSAALARFTKYDSIRYSAEETTPTSAAFKLDPAAPAYIIFTSGSTGKPKGISVARQSLNRFVELALDLFDITEDDKVLQFSALNWDTSSEEIYPCLAHGATLVLRSNAAVEHYKDLLERTTQHQLSVWNLPSSYWQELAQYLHGQKLELPDSLRLIIVGGEPVAQKALSAWYEKHGDRVKILNTYGATELTSISAACDLAPYAQADQYRPHLPIGKPLANTTAYILNERGLPAPVGSAGVLHFAGSSLAIAYTKDEALTAEKFFFHPKLGCRVYNTGDYAYYDATGAIYLIGRNDSYVKRRGIRIDLSMIANSVTSVAGVSFATADFHKSHSGQGEITLFLILEAQDLEVARRAIKAALAQHLSDQYQPDRIRYLSKAPRLANGKIDLKVLKQTAIALFEVSRKMKLSTATESKIAQIWQAVLGHKDFDESSAFNQVGGNSLLILKLKSLIEEEFKLEVPVSELFSNATCVKQAALVDSLLKTDYASDEQDIFKLLNALENDQIDLNTVKKTLKI